jgi:hypothetical protein
MVLHLLSIVNILFYFYELKYKLKVNLQKVLNLLQWSPYRQTVPGAPLAAAEPAGLDAGHTPQVVVSSRSLSGGMPLVLGVQQFAVPLRQTGLAVAAGEEHHLLK